MGEGIISEDLIATGWEVKIVTTRKVFTSLINENNKDALTQLMSFIYSTFPLVKRKREPP